MINKLSTSSESRIKSKNCLLTYRQEGPIVENIYFSRKFRTFLENYLLKS